MANCNECPKKLQVARQNRNAGTTYILSVDNKKQRSVLLAFDAHPFTYLSHQPFTNVFKQYKIFFLPLFLSSFCFFQGGGFFFPPILFLECFEFTILCDIQMIDLVKHHQLLQSLCHRFFNKWVQDTFIHIPSYCVHTL